MPISKGRLIINHNIEATVSIKNQEINGYGEILIAGKNSNALRTKAIEVLSKAKIISDKNSESEKLKMCIENAVNSISNGGVGDFDACIELELIS